MASPIKSGDIHVDACAANAGQHCNCGKLLAALADPTPTPIPDSTPNRRGVLLLAALVLGAAVIWACM